VTDPVGLSDLEPDERDVHLILSAVPPQAPPFGFRDAVMRRVVERRVGWELLVAALLALPSLAFLARQVAESGEDFAAALVNILGAATSATANASFFIDGLTVLAVTLVGSACVLAAHALIASTPRRRRPVR
jgi:ABC-type amino acid transport substrate-binding protein